MQCEKLRARIQIASVEDADNLLDDWAEKLVAKAAILVGCRVYYRIPVGGSLIDFLIQNPDTDGDGTLVEVTNYNEIDAKLDIRKLRQMQHMKDSKMNHVLLTFEHLMRININYHNRLQKTGVVK